VNQPDDVNCTSLAAAIARWSERPDEVEQLVRSALLRVVESDSSAALVWLCDLLQLILGVSSHEATEKTGEPYLEGELTLMKEDGHWREPGMLEASCDDASAKTVELYLEQGKLMLIWEDGRLREPGMFETAGRVRERLARRGYRLTGHRLSQAGVTRIYTKMSP
jgi:hypothetical protein